MSRYRFIDRHRDRVQELCAVLPVATSSYYAWRQRRQQPTPAWEQALVRACAHHGRRYGTRRLWAEVQAQGHGRRVVPNRLLGQPGPSAPNQVWVGDITCLPKQGGVWLYLASWQDACSRKIVGWDVREIMPENLVNEALRRALAVRQPVQGLIVHSDQGSQYTVTRFRDLLTQHGAAQSMSRRGNCYDNAQAEPFWSRLKTELLDGGSFPGLDEA